MAGKYDLGMLELGNCRIINSSPPQLLHSDPANDLQVFMHTIQVDRGLPWPQIEKVTSSSSPLPHLSFGQVRVEATLDHSIGIDEQIAQERREGGLSPRTSSRDCIVSPGYYRTKREGQGDSYVIFAMEKSFNYQVSRTHSFFPAPHLLAVMVELPSD
jgi:hypothetical protein